METLSISWRAVIKYGLTRPNSCDVLMTMGASAVHCGNIALKHHVAGEPGNIMYITAVVGSLHAEHQGRCGPLKVFEAIKGGLVSLM